MCLNNRRLVENVSEPYIQVADYRLYITIDLY